MLNKVIEIFIAMMILLPVFCLLNSIRFHSKKDTVGRPSIRQYENITDIG